MNMFEKIKIPLIESIAIVTLFLIKVYTYNKLIENGNVNIRISVVSLAYVLLVLGMVNLLTGRKRSIAFFLSYLIISFVMFADTAYFKYFNQLTSIVVLKQFSQLSTVGDSISYVLRPVNFLMLIDIIPIVLYLLYKHKKMVPKDSYNSKVDKKIAFGIVTGSLILVTSSVFAVNTFDSSINLSRQEFFTYHISDIYSTLFVKNEIDDVDTFLNKIRERSTNKEKNMFGIAKGKNVITIQVEGLQNFVINDFYEGQEITPNLNKMIDKDSIYFDRYYQQLGRGNTSDAEFATHNSLYPAMDGQTYLMYYENTYYGLPWILKDIGYETTAFHGYKAPFWNRDKAYPYQGFNRFISEENYEVSETIGLGLSDREFLKQSVDYLKDMESPYYAFLITLTSHHPFGMPDEHKKISLTKEHENTLFGSYLQSIHYVDSAIGEFIEELKKEGLYENTIINIYGDHFGLSSTDEQNKSIMTQYLGYEYDFDEMMRVPLIMNIPKSEMRQRISTVGAQVDFLPTLLNLLGIENRTGVMLGQDLINAKEGFVAQQTYMLKGSYIKEDIVFSMSRDGIFEHSRAWNPNTRKPVDLNICRTDYERAIKEINQSNYILEDNILEKYIIDRQELEIDEVDETISKNIEPEILISHAGGRVEGLSYTNSKEAIDKSYENGYKFIELDFEWTTDDNLVLIHDWNGYVKDAFSVESKRYSTEEFKNFNMIRDLTQMSIEDLAKWLSEHKDIYIVTDIKKDNVEALRLISNRYPDLIHQFIPQIYGIDEYVPVQGLGYSNIILTLYMSNYSDEEIIDFVRRDRVLAITMPIDRARTKLPAKLNEEKVFAYAHTINKDELRQELEENGINGFYTDDLLP